MLSVKPDWDWKLRLFVSLDVIGSTQLKARAQEEDSSDWVYEISGFYDGVPKHLRAGYRALPKGVTPAPQQLRVWKTVGDEILFVAELSHHTEAFVHLLACQHCIISFNELSREESGKGLFIKGTAWLGGFPVTNRAVGIEQNDNLLEDFIGPSMDLGFRLCRHASERRLILSTDLALVLIDGTRELDVDPIDLFYDGRVALRGIEATPGYPLIWMDTWGDKLSRADQREKKLLHKESPDSDLLHRYCRRFLNEHHGYLPFIAKGKKRVYGSIPKALSQRRKRLMELAASKTYEAMGSRKQQAAGDESAIEDLPLDSIP